MNGVIFYVPVLNLKDNSANAKSKKNMTSGPYSVRFRINGENGIGVRWMKQESGVEWGGELVTVGREREKQDMQEESEAHRQTAGKPFEVKPIFSELSPHCCNLMSKNSESCHTAIQKVLFFFVNAPL